MVLEAGYLLGFTVIGKNAVLCRQKYYFSQLLHTGEGLTWEVGIHIVDTVC